MEEKKTTQKESIFRKKALDRISSPEELDHYLTVTGPGVWLPLLAVIVLLIGGIVWMTFGQIDVTMNVAVESSNGTVVCYIPSDKAGSLAQGGCVTIAGKEYALKDVGFAVQLVTEEMNVNVRRAGSLEMSSLVCPMQVEAELAEGVYSGVITVESVHPMKYILN